MKIKNLVIIGATLTGLGLGLSSFVGKVQEYVSVEVGVILDEKNKLIEGLKTDECIFVRNDEIMTDAGINNIQIFDCRSKTLGQVYKYLGTLVSKEWQNLGNGEACLESKYTFYSQYEKAGMIASFVFLKDSSGKIHPIENMTCQAFLNNKNQTKI